MAGEPSRWPATIGVLAMVAGAVLMAVSAGNDPPRPRVLGEMLVATTTTTPAGETAGTDGPSTSRATAPRHVTSTTRPAAAPGPAATSTTEAPSSTSSSTSPSSNPPSTSTPTTRPCPSGAPVAEVRAWDGGSDGSGTWHVTVSGVVTNRTGAAARVGPVAVTVERADGDTYVIPADERPTPDPSTVADGGEATWRWDGDVPAGAAPVGARAAVTEWTGVDTPPGCITG